MLLLAPPLAQLVDALPGWAWNALLIAGMSAPLVGLLIAAAAKSTTPAKRTTVSVFYLLAGPLAFLLFCPPRSENLLIACPFLILQPVGIILGLIVVVPTLPPPPPERGPVQRGFEVEPPPRDRGAR